MTQLVVATDPAEPDDNGVRLRVTVTNPNPFAMRARALDWHLTLEPDASTRGRNPLNVELAPDARTTVDISLRSPRSAAIHGAHPTALDYALTGTLHVFSSHGDLAIPLHSVGALTSTPAPDSTAPGH